MCSSTRSLTDVVESVCVILLTISVATIGATLYLYETTAERLTSVVICGLNMLFNILLLFGLKERNTFLILLWMISALYNIVGAIVIFGFLLHNGGNNLFIGSEYIIATSLMRAIFLISYFVLHIWSGIQVYNLYKEFIAVNKRRASIVCDVLLSSAVHQTT